MVLKVTDRRLGTSFRSDREGGGQAAAVDTRLPG